MAEVVEIREEDPTTFLITIVEEDPSDPNNFIPVDLTGFGTITVRFQKPDGVTNVDKTATLVDAPNGVVTVTMGSGDFDVLEQWHLQGIVDTGSGVFRTDIEGIYIHENL